MLSVKQRKTSKNAFERYQHLSEEERNKKCQYARERYRNLSEGKNKKRKYGYEQYKNLPEDK